MSGPQKQPATFSAHLASPTGKALHLSSIATSSIAGQLGNPSYGPSPHMHNAVGTQSRGGPCPKDPTLQPEPGRKSLAGRAGYPGQQLAQQAWVQDSAEHLQQRSALSQVLLASPHPDS